MTKGGRGGGQKSQKIDDVFYKQPLSTLVRKRLVRRQLRFKNLARSYLQIARSQGFNLINAKLSICFSENCGIELTVDNTKQEKIDINNFIVSITT